MAPLETGVYVYIVSSTVQDATLYQAPLSRYNKSCPPNTVPSTKTSPLPSLRFVHNHALAYRDLRSSNSCRRPTTYHPPARPSRVVSSSIRNLVLPCTSSPRPLLEMTFPVIDCKIVHGTILPAQRTPPWRSTTASSFYLHRLRLQRKMSVRAQRYLGSSALSSRQRIRSPTNAHTCSNTIKKLKMAIARSPAKCYEVRRLR